MHRARKDFTTARFERLCKVVAATCLLPLVFGCSSTAFTSDTAQVVRANRVSDDLPALAVGRELSQFGQRQLASGRTKITAGGEKIRRGERLIERGSGQVSRNRSQYETRVQQVEPDDPRLTAIKEEWDEGIAQIREGNALITEGRREIEQGQIEVREGRTVMESAATMIRTAERTYREPAGP